MTRADGVISHQLWRLTNPHQCGHDGHGNHAIDYGAPDQRLDRIHFKVTHQGADAGGRHDDGVKTARLMKTVREPGLPAIKLTDGVGRRTRQHRDREQTGSDYAQRKNRKCKFTGDRSEGFRRLG